MYILKKERCTMKYKSYEFDTFKIYTIKTDKFKNCHMEITFYDNDVSFFFKIYKNKRFSY